MATSMYPLPLLPHIVNGPRFCYEAINSSTPGYATRRLRLCVSDVTTLLSAEPNKSKGIYHYSFITCSRDIDVTRVIPKLYINKAPMLAIETPFHNLIC